MELTITNIGATVTVSAKSLLDVAAVTAVPPHLLAFLDRKLKLLEEGELAEVEDSGWELSVRKAEERL